MTWLVDRLEERGLAERRALPSDRRVKTIALTPKGVEFRRRMLVEMFTPPEELLGLDAATLEALRSDLEKLPAPEGTSWFAPVGRPARKTSS
jgi:DNA-binding MarR family transcriptional regulator